MLLRIKYYLSSIPTILGQLKNWYMLLPLLFQKQPIVITLRHPYQFKVRSLMDVWVIKETCLDRDYEINGVPIEDGWTVIDIGAGIGEFAILTAKEHPRTQVYAYEPFAESFALLEENLKMNAVHNVKPYQTAVSSTSGEITLVTTGEAVQHTTTHSEEVTHDHMVAVQAITLDALFHTNNLTHCDFLKMDCEGCEFEILLNANPITLRKINHICLEYHDGFTDFSHVDLVNYLQQNGFQVKATPNPVHSYLGFLYAHR